MKRARTTARNVRPARSTRVYAGERVLGVLLGLLIGIATLAAFQVPWLTPVTGDQLEKLDVTYTVQPDGKVQVREELTLRFGLVSGRHGLARSIIVRKPQGDHDARWPVSNVQATSPSGHNAWVHQDWVTSVDKRTEVLWIRLGDPDNRIKSRTASYVLTYVQDGLVRPTGQGGNEFSINVGGPKLWARDVTTRIVTPEPATAAQCWVSFGRCDGVGVDGRTAISRVGGINAAQQATVAAQLPAGAVQNSQRLSAPAGGPLLGFFASPWTWLLPTAATGLIGWLVGFVGAPRSGKDRRYANVAPGVIPQGSNPATVKDHEPQIPVAFTPPDLTLAEAGFLLDGQPRPRHLAATLVALAAAGTIELVQGGNGRSGRIRLVRRSDLDSEPQAGPLATAFANTDELPLDDDRLLLAYGAMADDAEDMAENKKWVNRIQGRAGSYLDAAWAKVAGSAANQDRNHDPAMHQMTSVGWHVAGWMIPPALLVWLVWAVTEKLFVGIAMLGPILAPVVTVGWGQNFAVKRQPRVRTAAGRAMTDRVEGFRQYLMTAEADQLRFQEGQDLYVGYLPWAVLFGCADRWAKVCQQAVGDGLLPAPTVDLTTPLASLAGTSSDLDRGLSHTFTDLRLDRDWTPPTPTSGPASWLGSGGGDSSGGGSSSSGGGAGSGGSGGSYGSW